MHEATEAWVRYADHKYGPFGRVAEFGGRDVNGRARDMLRARDYCSVDLRPGAGVDVVADALTWEPRERFDLVVCTNVFEHVKSWPVLVGRAFHILAPTGLFVVATVADPFPVHSGIDGELLRPEEHYANISIERLCAELVLAGFDVLDEMGEPPDSQAIARKPHALEVLDA